MKTELEKMEEGGPLDEDTENLVALISTHAFLKGLPPKHLQVLAASAMLKRFKPGEMIFREGDVANRFYLIQKGKVALESSDKDFGPVLIQHIGAGDVLGWSWLFPPYYWHFDAKAVEPTEAIFFYGTRLREQCEEDAELGYELMKRMAEIVIKRLQHARKQLLEMHRGQRLQTGENISQALDTKAGH